MLLQPSSASALDRTPTLLSVNGGGVVCDVGLPCSPWVPSGHRTGAVWAARARPSPASHLVPQFSPYLCAQPAKGVETPAPSTEAAKEPWALPARAGPLEGRTLGIPQPILVGWLAAAPLVLVLLGGGELPEPSWARSRPVAKSAEGTGTGDTG